MHPDRGTVRTYRRSDSLSMRPDDPNTPTRQSNVTNDAPKYPIHGPIAWDPTYFTDTLRLRLRLRLVLWLSLRLCLQLRLQIRLRL